MKRIFILVISFQFFAFNQEPSPYNYLALPQVESFITKMHKRYGFDKEYLRSVFKQAKFDKATLDKYTGTFKPGSTVGTWERFKRNIVNAHSFRQAKVFYEKHKKSLQKAERLYGVDARYIVGFIGVETRYGKFTGNHTILDSLATLAFHPNRKQHFFKNELKHLFLFAKERNLDITKIKGSFAGAMGCVQQLPSIAGKFNVDFDGDGASVWDMNDCIGSIAKFMHNKGWAKGLDAAVEANFKGKRFRKLRYSFKKVYKTQTLLEAGLTPTKPFPYKNAYLLRVSDKEKDRIFFGTKNFRVLTRYNPSTNYGVAIDLIADSLRNERHK